MKHPIVKLTGAVILLVALLFGFYRMNVSGIDAMNAASFERMSAGKLDSLIEAKDSIESDLARAFETTLKQMLSSAELEAGLLRRSAEYAGLANRENEMVVRVVGGRTVYPAGSAVRFNDDDLFGEVAMVSVTTLKGDANADAEPAQVLVCTCPVEGDRYYVAWTDEQETVDLFVTADKNMSELMTNVEIAHSGFSGFFLSVVDREDGLAFAYRSYRFDSYETPEAMGITREVLAARPNTLNIDGISYYCDFRSIGDGRETGIYLAAQSSAGTDSRGQATIITALAGIILTALAAWHLATQRFVVDKILTVPMQVRYKPSSMRWMTLVLGGIAIAAIFGTACVVHSIDDFSGRSAEAQISLSILGHRLQEDATQEASKARSSEEWQLRCARRMAEAVGVDPGLAAGEALAQFSDTLGAKYIMLFDGDGNECACSDRYTGFSLGDKPEDSTTDFRRLLLGVPELAHAPAVDERTGLNTRMVGVSCRMPDGRYGALILAFEPEAVDATTDSNAVLDSQTAPGWTALAFDAQSRTVRFSSDADCIGMSAEYFGVTEDSFGKPFVDNFNLKDRNCYGFSMERDGLVYYFINNASGLSEKTAAFGAQAAGGFAIIYLIMAVYLMLGYTKRQFDYYSVIGAEFDGNAAEAVLPDGKVKRSVDPSRRWSFNFADVRNMLPEQVGKSVFSVGIGLCIGWAIVEMLVSRYASNEIIRFIVSGEWNRGLNLFAVVAIVMLALVTILALLLIKLVLKLAAMAMDTKGETICRLAFNLVEYVAVLLLLFYGFEFLGVDVRALLAPLALVSLALSLGSRQLVEDILAGVTIVFEGEYQVGDVVDVGGYRGKVLEVGVRTTKLLGKGDNIKIISNRDVRNVLNMSRMNSWVDMEFTVPNTVPLQKIEEIMERELPRIGQSIPDIISGPVYKGIVSMGANKVTIAVTCECKEEDSFLVQRELYARFHEMFERESLPLA